MSLITSLICGNGGWESSTFQGRRKRLPRSKLAGQQVITSSSLPPPTYLFLNNFTDDQRLEQEVDNFNAASLTASQCQRAYICTHFTDVEIEPQGNFVTFEISLLVGLGSRVRIPRFKIRFFYCLTVCSWTS